MGSVSIQFCHVLERFSKSESTQSLSTRNTVMVQGKRTHVDLEAPSNVKSSEQQHLDLQREIADMTTTELDAVLEEIAPFANSHGHLAAILGNRKFIRSSKSLS